MPRKMRFSRLNSRHHVMLRGVAGQNIFVDDKDRIRLCFLIQEAAEKHDFIVHAFCFMSNHLHFIMEPTATLFKTVCMHLLFDMLNISIGGTIETDIFFKEDFVLFWLMMECI